jgi:hypothetical protein
VLGRIVGYGAREAGGFRGDVAAIPDALKRAEVLESLGAKALIVVAAGKGQQAGWTSAQDELATLDEQRPPARSRLHPRLAPRRQSRRGHIQPSDPRRPPIDTRFQSTGRRLNRADPPVRRSG